MSMVVELGIITRASECLIRLGRTHIKLFLCRDISRVLGGNKLNQTNALLTNVNTVLCC